MIPYVGREVKYVDARTILIVEISGYEVIDSEEEFAFIPREIIKDDADSFRKEVEFRRKRPVGKEFLEWSILME